jgi:hypothetical protein
LVSENSVQASLISMAYLLISAAGHTIRITPWLHGYNETSSVSEVCEQPRSVVAWEPP